MERVAVADLGSNSWRLVVYGYEPGTPWWSPVDEIREAVRVGAGMGEERILQPERIDRALHTAAVFDSFCRASGIDQVEAIATSAIRDAANSEELLDAIRERTGLRPRVISGRRGGALRLAGHRELDDDLRRLRPRHRRRQHPGDAPRRPAARSGRVAAVRIRAGERGVPARREGVGQGHQGAAQARGVGARGARLVAGRRTGRRASAARSATSPRRRCATPSCR